MKNILILLFITVTLSVVQGQHTPKNSEEQLFKYHDYEKMGDIFKTNALAYKNYKESFKHRRVFEVLGFLTLGELTIGGLLVLNIDSEEECYPYCKREVASTAILLLFAPLTGMVAIIHKRKEVRKRRTAINLITGQHASDLGYSTPTLELKATMGVNGIGLTLNF